MIPARSLRSSAVALLVGSGALSLPSAALAAEWGEVLPADAVESYLAGEDLTVMVVAAGGGAECDSAAAALTVALNEASRAKVVMSADSLGDVSGLSDDEIVAKAAKLPLDLVAVARVFPAGEESYSMVTTLYDKAGEVASAFTATSDEVLTAQEGGAGSGVTTAAAEAVSSVSGGLAVNQKEARQQYEERVIWFQGMASIDADTGQILSTWSVPYKGKYKEPLKGSAFYTYMGHDDLAQKYKKRNGIRWGIVGGGLAAAGVGGLMLYQSLDDMSATSMTTPTALLVVGVTLVGGANFFNPNPVDPPTAYRLADEFNDQLAEELGLEPVSQFTEPAAAEPAVLLAAAPFAMPGGGGVAVGLTF